MGAVELAAVSRPRALDLYCRAGGVSQGLVDAGFEVVGVDIGDHEKAYNKGPGSSGHAVYVRADALEYPLEGFDLICASFPCQASSALRHLQKGREYPQLIPATRERLKASGIPYGIENVPGSPLETSIVLCGTMFGLQTPDGRAELRRHRHFEVSFPISLRPECRHGKGAVIPGHTPVDNRGRKERDERMVITVTGDRPNAANTPRKVLWMSGGMMTPRGELKRRAISITGSTPQTNFERNTVRERGPLVYIPRVHTFSTDDARHAMGISWMTMKDLSQAIPPVYAEFLGRLLLGELPVHLLAAGACQVSLF